MGTGASQYTAREACGAAASCDHLSHAFELGRTFHRDMSGLTAAAPGPQKLSVPAPSTGAFANFDPELPVKKRVPAFLVEEPSMSFSTRAAWAAAGAAPGRMCF